MKLCLFIMLALAGVVNGWTVGVSSKCSINAKNHRNTQLEGAAPSSDVGTPPPKRTFLLGTGFLQFLVSTDLIKTSTSTPVLMADMAKSEGLRSNWCPPPAVVVTNGQGEWESEAAQCTSLVVCPEASDIPGKTVTALLSKMPLCKKVVVVSPAGTTTGRPVEEKEDNWLFNR